MPPVQNTTAIVGARRKRIDVPAEMIADWLTVAKVANIGANYDASAVLPKDEIATARADAQALCRELNAKQNKVTFKPFTARIEGQPDVRQIVVQVLAYEAPAADAPEPDAAPQGENG